MSKFKKGDRVKINREYDIRYNEFGTVTRVSDEFDDAFIVFDSDNRGTFYELKFLELINMSNFKIGDHVKIINGCNIGKQGTVTNHHGCFVAVDVIKDHGITPNLAYEFNELELIEMPKFVKIKKYAVVGVNGNSKDLGNLYYSEKEVEHFNSVGGHGWKYHIVPTLFTEEEVPVKTETRYTFICKSPVTGNYYETVGKYATLEQAKSSSAGNAFQQIDSSAEEFEIE